MIILGISCYYHDSAACLIKDGKIIAAAAEERFSRIKHDNRFPKLAIDFCLKKIGIAAKEIDSVAFYEKPLVKFERVISQHLEYFPKSLGQFIKYMAPWFNERLNLNKTFKEELNYHGPIRYINHHLSHAASSYYLSGFKKAAIVNIDGVGEWTTTSIGLGENNKIRLDKELHFPDSLGLLYSTFTTYLGFEANDAEYKVMGLASYGDPKPFKKHFDQIIKVFPDGSFKLNMKFFDFVWREQMPSKKLIDLFGHPIRQKEAKIFKHHEDIAAALQNKLQEVIFNLLNQVQKKYKTQNLCLAGGVALNSVMNGKILQNTSFKKFFIPPDPGDGGGAMGAALELAASLGEKVAKNNRDFHPYLGPSYSWYQVEHALKKAGLKYQLISKEKELIKQVSDLIIQQKVIGWFQGPVEWGPRALGNRSILASAKTEEMRDIINAKVKKRELFRPFAPVIIESEANKYFHMDKYFSPSLKWMLTVHPFKEKAKKLVPAVVHVDGSGRPETLARNDNPLYYDLLEAYFKKTGIPTFINTSFNVRGEPIVCTPQDAINCFLQTDIDHLVIDQYIVSK
jgi:carbamoyltransferase